ncbi:MAG: HK97 family phage prohead protease [Candidatus Doudnabacteria bacterium]
MLENKMFAYAQKSEMLDNENSIVCYASTNEVDRHGEMILASAWTEEGLKNYRVNPVILVNHDYWSLPVAKSIWQKTDSNGLKFKIKFADTEAGKEVYSLYKNGFMSSFSVGFRPVKTYDNEKSQKYVDKNGKVPDTVYEECELLELSCVTIPANPSATVINGAKSMVASFERGEIKSAEVKSMVEKLKDSKEYIELTSEPTEEKAKVIGHIDLEKKCEHCENKDTAKIEKDGSCPVGNETCNGGICEEYDTCQSDIKTPTKSKKDAMPCDGEDGGCDGGNCPQYEGCNKPIKKSLGNIEEKSVGSSSLPISESSSWDGNSAVNAMREYAGGKDNMDWGKYAKGFAYFDSSNKEDFGSYKLPFADIIDGKLTAVWGGVNAAMAAINGARQNMTISDSDREKAYNLLDKYYNKFGKEAPEFQKSFEIQEEKSNMVIESNLDDKFKEILEEIKSIRAYVDEKIEKTLKFPEENADKVYTEKVEEKDVIDFEIRKETIDLDFTPEDVKKMVIESILSAKSKTQSVSDLVEERIKKAKGIIF